MCQNNISTKKRNEEKKVSLVTVVYNKAPFLRRCFNSLIAQKYDNLEILIVDNGSTDESSQIIHEYADLDERIKVVEIEVNIGPANGIRIGLNNITGEYFTFVDSDDYVDSNYVYELYQAIIGDEADIAMCPNDLVWDDNSSKQIKKLPENTHFVIEGKDVNNLLSYQLLDELNNQYFGFYLPELGAEWGKLYRTSLIKENCINYDISLWIWCDWVFNINVLNHVKKLVYTNKTTYHFYQGNESVTRVKDYRANYKEHFIAAMNKMYLAVANRYDEKMEAALNVFRFRQLSIIERYYSTYYPKFLSFDELYKIISDFLSEEEILKLYQSERKECLSDSERKFLQTINSKKKYKTWLKNERKKRWCIEKMKKMFSYLRVEGVIRNMYHKING